MKNTALLMLQQAHRDFYKMANSKTEHSKKLRGKTANQNKSKNFNQKTCLFDMRKDEDIKLFKYFESLDGQTSEKFKKMILFHQKNF